MLAAGADARLPLRPDWEYAVLALAGEAEVDGAGAGSRPAALPGPGPPELALRAERAARLLLIGGEPFEEHLVMWWNFVGRDHEDIVAARDQWMAADARFGPVRGYPGHRLASATDAQLPGSSHAGDSGNILHFTSRAPQRFRWAPAAVSGPDHRHRGV